MTFAIERTAPFTHKESGHRGIITFSKEIKGVILHEFIDLSELVFSDNSKSGWWTTEELDGLSVNPEPLYFCESCEILLDEELHGSNSSLCSECCPGYMHCEICQNAADDAGVLG